MFGAVSTPKTALAWQLQHIKMKNLTSSQVKTLADIFVGVGVVILGSVSIPIAFNLGSTSLLTFGIATSLVFWYIAIRISKYI